MTIVGEATLEIEADTSGVARAIRNDRAAERAARVQGESLGQTVTRGFRSGIEKGGGLSLGKLTGAGVLANGITALGSRAAQAGRNILTIGIAYQDQLNTFGSLGPQYAAAIGQVSKASLALGNDLTLPSTSAADAAGAITELAKAGLSARDAMAAAKGTLQLATAGTLDAGLAAKITSNALNTFALQGDQATRVANVFANAANASSGEVTDFADGLAQSGLVAKQANQSLEQTVGALALFAQNGLKGSDAGTSLKTAILRLIAPLPAQAKLMENLGIKTRDSKGNFAGLGVVADSLRDKLGKLTPKQRDAALANIFGQDAVRAGVVLYNNGSKGLDTYVKAVGRAGGAQEVAAAKSKGLGGALKGLKSNVESGLITTFLKVSPILEPIVRDIAARLPDAVDSLGRGLDLFLPKVSSLIKGFQDGTGTGGDLRDTFDKVQDVGGALGRAFTDTIIPAVTTLGRDALPLVNGALDILKPTFEFIADHPALFTQIAKDAVILAAALKAKAFVEGLGLLSRFKGGGALSGAAGGLGSSVTSRGGTPVNPLYVAVVNGGVGGFPTTPIPGVGGKTPTTRIGKAAQGARKAVGVAGKVLVVGIVADEALKARDALVSDLASKVNKNLTERDRQISELILKINTSTGVANTPGGRAGVKERAAEARRAVPRTGDGILKPKDFDPVKALEFLRLYGKNTKEAKAAIEALASDPRVIAALAKQKAAIDRLAQSAAKSGTSAGKGFTDNLTSALSGGLDLTPQGKGLAQSLADGVGTGFGAKLHHLVELAKSFGAKVAAAVKDGAQVKSPSKITAEAGEGIATGVIVGLDKNADAARARAAKLGREAAEAALNASEKAVQDRLDKTQAKLGAVQDFRTGVRDNLASSLNLTRLQGDGRPQSSSAFVGTLATSVGRLRTFGKDLATLGRLGFSAGFIRQVAEAGVDEGGPIASALAKSTPGQVKTLNSLQKAGNALSGTISTAASQSVYGSKTETVLIAQQKALMAELTRIRKALENLPSGVGAAVTTSLNGTATRSAARSKTTPGRVPVKTP